MGGCFFVGFWRRAGGKAWGTMKRLLSSRLVSQVLTWLFLTSLVYADEAPAPAREFAGSTPLAWSVRMADSEIARRGDSLAWKEGGTAKWDYTAGLFTLSLLKLNERAANPAYVDFAKQAIGSFIELNGNIHGYKAEEYNLDNINPGKTVIALYQLTKEERYEKTARLLRHQLDGQPRVSEGGFWHKLRYTNQMWLDGLYMASPFYAQCAVIFHDPAAFTDVARQFRVVAAHTYDAKTGLFYHGWDESKEQSWAS